MRSFVLNREAAIITVLIVCMFGLYSLDRTRLGQSVPDEKRYLQSTKEMLESGDYVTPRYHGKLRFQKPILFYWLIVLSYKIFGIGIFAARVPSIIASALNIILTYLLARDLFGKRAGVFSALALSTCEVYFMYSRLAVPDISFILFITAALYIFVRTRRGGVKNSRGYMYMYAAMALAMLIKGPLGFIYPMAAICLFVYLKKTPSIFREIGLLPGLLLFAAISAPWFIVMTAIHGGDYIGNAWSLEIIKKMRFAGSGGCIIFQYLRAAFYYMGMVFARHLPWSAFLPAALIYARGFPRDSAEGRDGFKVITAWFLAVFMCLTLIGSRESYYILAASVPVSIFLGVYLAALSREDRLSKGALFRLPFILAIIAYSAGLLIWLWFNAYVLGGGLISFSLLLFLVPPLMLGVYAKNNKPFLPVAFFIAAFAFFACFAGCVMPAVDKEPLSGIAEEIKISARPGDVVGVASSAVSYHRLNVLLEDYKVIRVDKKKKVGAGAWEPDDKKDCVKAFLRTKDKRIFCVISESDYYEFVGEPLRRRLTIVKNASIWKKLHKQDKEYFKRLITYVMKGEKGLLRQNLKEEIYLLSNQ